MQKVFFKLEVVDDYPPVAMESVWSERLESGFYKIKTIPFYTKDARFEDEVGVVAGDDGALVFAHIVQPSRNSTLRVIIFDEGVGGIQTVHDALVKLGCSWEGLNENFFSVNIPWETDLDEILAFLDKATEVGWLDYEFGMIRQ